MVIASLYKVYALCREVTVAQLVSPEKCVSLFFSNQVLFFHENFRSRD